MFTRSGNQYTSTFLESAQTSSQNFPLPEPLHCSPACITCFYQRLTADTGSPPSSCRASARCRIPCIFMCLVVMFSYACFVICLYVCVCLHVVPAEVSFISCLSQFASQASQRRAARLVAMATMVVHTRNPYAFVRRSLERIRAAHERHARAHASIPGSPPPPVVSISLFPPPEWWVQVSGEDNAGHLPPFWRVEIQWSWD